MYILLDFAALIVYTLIVGFIYMGMIKLVCWIISEIHNIRENYWIGSDKEIKRLVQKINDRWED